MLIPSKGDIEKIFRLYNNQCWFHDCSEKIIDSDNHVNGKMLFIESNQKEHPRYNSKLCTTQLTDHTNLILVCDIHSWDIEKDSRTYTIEKLKNKLLDDLQNLPDSNFELTDKMYQEFLFHFIEYHDPDRFSHFKIKDDAVYFGYSWQDNTTYIPIHIKPTKHFVGGKFEIIDTCRKIQKFDEVFFYPAKTSVQKGIQADIEIKSSMNIQGVIPNLLEGKYFVAIVSAIDQSSKLEQDLEFTVIPSPRN